MKPTRAIELITQELDELVSRSSPYVLSSPQFGDPNIHKFVKGLILSTNIIEFIDKHIPNGYRADWGQVIDERDGNTLSRECDIIIYRGKPYKVVENKSIRFVLVDKKNTKIVIQVRSNIQSVTKEDKQYCRELKKFVPEMWYIAESCWAKNRSRAVTIEKELKSIGYNRFFYFCRVEEDPFNRKIEYEPFIKFIKSIKKIK